MNDANFILGINLLVAGLFAAAFLAIARHERQGAPALRLGCAYGIGVAYYAIEFLVPAFRDAGFAVTAAFAVFLLATMAFNAALGSKYGVPLPFWPMLVFLGVTSGAVWLSQDLPRQSLMRMMAYQLPYALMQFVGLGIVWRSRQKLDGLDRTLMAVLAASALHFLAKPFIAHGLGGWGADPQSYHASPYAVVSQSLGTVFAIALALLTLVILVRDVLADATSRSERDTLSGLLNRGGFQRRAEQVFRDAVRRRLPLALVIADLDHFKEINDSFGHACGDRVIESFAGLLRQAAAEHHIAARIGGEEFAVLLPGLNLAGARLFAEGTRSAFGGLPVEGLPTDHRCTASFGVTELLPHDGMDDLMRRADRALYAAKRGGRDQIRVAMETAGEAASPRAAGFSGRG
jgi:diguanylate cyclase (GGDEF)-like protein